MKDIKELNKWGDIPSSWIGRFNIAKVLNLPNLIYRFKAISIKIPKLFCGYQQTDSKVYIERQKIQNSHHNFEVEEQS